MCQTMLLLSWKDSEVLGMAVGNEGRRTDVFGSFGELV